MDITRFSIEIIIAAIVTIVLFVQFKKKYNFSTGKSIAICAVTFILLCAVGVGINILMGNINFFGN